MQLQTNDDDVRDCCSEACLGNLAVAAAVAVGIA